MAARCCAVHVRMVAPFVLGTATSRAPMISLAKWNMVPYCSYRNGVPLHSIMTSAVGQGRPSLHRTTRSARHTHLEPHFRRKAHHDRTTRRVGEADRDPRA